MISHLGQVAVGIADSLMVGRLDTEALAAVAFANSIFAIFLLFGIGLGYGMTPLVAEADGRKDPHETGRLLTDGFWVTMLSALLLIAIMLSIMPLFHNLGQDPAIIPKAQGYFFIIACSYLPFMSFQCFRMLAEGMSDTKMAMLISLACVGINIILNVLLIYGYLGFPALGIYGAAIASLIARILMAVWMAYYIYTHKRFKLLPKSLHFAKVSLARMRKILTLGLPTGLQYIFEVTAFSLAAIIVGQISAAALAAHQIAISLASVSYIVASGIGSAALVRVGNQLGEKNFENLRLAANTLFLMTLAWMTFTGLAFLVGRYYLPGLFTFDQEVIELTAGLLLIAVFFQLSDGIQVVALGALRGMKDVKIPTIITFIAYWLMALPLGWYLGVYLEMGARGVWYSLAAGLTTAALLLIFRFYGNLQKLKKVLS